MKFRSILLASVLVLAAAPIFIASVGGVGPRGFDGATLEQAEAFIDDLKYAEAESTLSLVIRSARDEELQESLFLLAGLTGRNPDIVALII